MTLDELREVIEGSCVGGPMPTRFELDLTDPDYAVVWMATEVRPIEGGEPMEHIDSVHILLSRELPSMSHEYLSQRIKGALLKTWDHELSEWLTIGGRRPFDPHPHDECHDRPCNHELCPKRNVPPQES